MIGHRKLATSTLERRTKKQLIEYIRCMEANLDALDERCEAQYRQLLNVRLGQETAVWVRNKRCYADKRYIYNCSKCGTPLVTTLMDDAVVLEAYPYCHCGAKMIAVEVK